MSGALDSDGVCERRPRAVHEETLQARHGGWGGNGYMGLQFGTGGLQADEKPSDESSKDGGDEEH